MNAEQNNPVLERLGISSNVLEGTDRPIVHIVVEGKVGSGKTAIVAMIQDLLKDKVDVVIKDDYTRNEMRIHQGANNEAELKMYRPVVVLCERLATTLPSLTK